MHLVYFISGMIFSTFLQPIIEELGDCIVTQLEVWKARSGQKINDVNIKIQKAANEASIDESPVHAIGFQMPDNEEEIYDDDDEEE